MKKILYEGNPYGFFDPYTFKARMENKYDLRCISLTKDGSRPIRQVYDLGKGAVAFYMYNPNKSFSVQVIGTGKRKGINGLRGIIEKEKSLYDKISPELSLA